MKLEEALVELRKGRKIRHKNWAPGMFINRDTPVGWLKYVRINLVELLCDRWEISKPPFMSFCEAMKAVAEGKMVSRGIVRPNGISVQTKRKSCLCQAEQGIARLSMTS